jgi:hypothetical protein
MEKMIAYCGLNCLDCQAYIATQKDDDEERRKVAEGWTKQFGHTLKIEDINCDGCLSNSNRMFSHCRVCSVRKCASGKGVANCGYCADYPCESVGFIINNAPSAKVVLDGIHNSLS